MTDENGEAVQVLDYYPFGSERISTGSNTTDRHYIGERFDTETDLNYLNARYYTSTRGQFLSQDPVFLAVGNQNQIREHAPLDQEQLLVDPQLLNSYSYARNNPITLKDPEGKIAFVPLLGYIYSAYSAAQIGIGTYDYINTNFRYDDVFSQEEKNQSAFKLGYDLVLTAFGAKIGRDVGKSAEVGFDTLTATLDVLDTYSGRQIYEGYNGRHDLNNQSRITPSTNNYSNNPQSSQYSSQDQGGGGYNQLIGGLNQLVSSLRSYVSSLSENNSGEE